MDSYENSSDVQILIIKKLSTFISLYCHDAFEIHTSSTDIPFNKNSYKSEDEGKIFHRVDFSHVRRSKCFSAPFRFTYRDGKSGNRDGVRWPGIEGSLREQNCPVDDKNRNQFLERQYLRAALSRIDSKPCISMACQSGRTRYSCKMIISGCPIAGKFLQDGSFGNELPRDRRPPLPRSNILRSVALLSTLSSLRVVSKNFDQATLSFSSIAMLITKCFVTYLVKV